jgi:hypothetical protein
MAQLYADEDFSYPVVEQLRLRGHDVLTAQEAGQAQQRITDPVVLAFAIAQGRAVLTFNRRHFKRLHQQTRPHTGIVICSRDDDIVALADRIHHAIQIVGLLDNQLLVINRPP